MEWRGLRFDGKTALVTGASSGIGRATAEALARLGANLVLVARRAETLAEIAEQARDVGVQALAAPADVTDRTAVRAAFRKGVRKFGTLDLVVNNAGVLSSSLVTDLQPAELQRMLDVNLFGALHVLQAAVEQMRKQPEGGHVVNVASLAGRRGFSPLGGYCASKFALVGLTEALRTELVGEPIGISLVLPGVVDTPMAEQIAADPTAQAQWPSKLNMPADWVVWSILVAARFRLAEVGVPPGSALIEKIAALVPGSTDRLLHRAMNFGRKRAGRRDHETGGA